MNKRQFAIFSFIAFAVGIAITFPIGVIQILAGQIFVGITSVAVAVFLVFLDVRLTQWWLGYRDQV